MRVLMMSTDKVIFDENSEVRQRMVEYARLVKRLDIIVFTRHSFQFPIFNFQNLFVYPTNSRSRWLYVFDAIKIGKKIERPDLVTAQDPFESGVVGHFLAKKFGLPLQLQIHVDFLSPYFGRESVLNKVRVILAKFLIPRAKCVRVVSQRIKNSLDLRFKNKDLRITVLPIFVDTEKIQKAPVKTNLRAKYSQFDFIILMASRLNKEKNIGLAINAMSDVVGQYPKTGLIIVGEGPEREALKLQVTSYKLQANIIIEPWTEDLSSYYKTADLFLLTSNYEGYGRTLIEAAAAGCGIISSDAGIAPEILPKENIFEVNNKEQLKQKIIGAMKGNLKSPKQIMPQIRELYLRKYQEGWLNC